MTTITLVPPVKLGSQPLGAAWLDALIDVKVEHVYQAPGRATLRFVDPGYTLSSTAESIAPGTALDVGDPAGGSALFVGSLVSVGVEQRVGEHPELVLVAYDDSFKLARQSQARAFTNITYSDVVTQVCADAALSVNVTATDDTVPYLMQADTDLALITEVARRIGFDWWMVGSTLYFGPPEAGATVTLALGTTLRSFSAKAVATGPTTVNVAGWDLSSQDVVTGTSTTSDVVPAVKASSTIAGLAANRADTVGAASVFTARFGVASSGEAQTVGNALVNRVAATSVRATGVADGNANLAVGAVAQVQSAGPLSGSYPVTRVEHTYRSRTGFVTRFWSGDRQPTTLADSLNVSSSPNATFSGTGLTVGTVTKNDGDPDASGRIQVLYPGLSNQYASGWARVVAMGGGKTRGNVFIPEVGDEVLIGFECADTRRPVVLGGLYGKKSTTPPTGVDGGTVNSRTLTSRLGHVIGLLDGTSAAEQAIELTLAGGEHKLHLGKDNVVLSVPAGLAVTVQAGSSTQVAFDTSGNVTVKGANITLQATQKVSIKAAQIEVDADTTLKMQGQTQASIQAGAQLQLSADGPTAIKGAIVQIN